MIVITGPGRSGTSLLARIYANAGIDPGGVWREDVRAGLERGDVSLLNRRILASLGVSTLGMRKRVPRIDDLPVGHGARVRLKQLIPQQQRLAIRRGLEGSRMNRARNVALIDWERVGEAAIRFGPEIRRLSESVALAKDPQMSWTLPVWQAAGAKLDHVVVTVRDVDAMIDSRSEAGHLRFTSRSDARNSMVYAVGVLLTSLADGATLHTVLRFPDFLDDLDALAALLPLPDESARPALASAVRDSVDFSLVTRRSDD